MNLLHYEEITYEGFDNLFTNEPLQEFNLREVVHLSSEYFKDSEVGYLGIETHHLIISCYNNGVIFLQFTGYSWDKLQIWATYNYDTPNIEGIHTEKAFLGKNKIKNFSFFTSVPSPPVVYEFHIDPNMNVHIHRVFSSYTDETRYTCHNRITSNQNYVAHLLFDNKLQKQVIRVYNRDETNFNLGHVNILLNDYNSQVSSMVFLSYNK